MLSRGMRVAPVRRDAVAGDHVQARDLAELARSVLRSSHRPRRPTSPGRRESGSTGRRSDAHRDRPPPPAAPSPRLPRSPAGARAPPAAGNQQQCSRRRGDPGPLPAGLRWRRRPGWPPSPRRHAPRRGRRAARRRPLHGHVRLGLAQGLGELLHGLEAVGRRLLQRVHHDVLDLVGHRGADHLQARHHLHRVPGHDRHGVRAR